MLRLLSLCTFVFYMCLHCCVCVRGVCVIFQVLTVLSFCSSIVLYACLPCRDSVITITVSLNCVQLLLQFQDQSCLHSSCEHVCMPSFLFQFFLISSVFSIKKIFRQHKIQVVHGLKTISFFSYPLTLFNYSFFSPLNSLNV